MYELKNQGRMRYRYRMNQVTNTFLNKEYVPQYRKYCGRKVLDGAEANRMISNLIEGGRPFWIGRYGNTELNLIYTVLRKRYVKSDQEVEKAFKALCNNAGFFPGDIDMAEHYTDLILDCCSEMDGHGIWPLYMEDYIIKKYERNIPLFRYIYLEPWGLSENPEGVRPWSHSLKGKKVLVIHPFEDTIKSQYMNKRERIFEKIDPRAENILPQFELKTLKAVQTLAGNSDERFDNWFEALAWMVEECRKIDFDIAILGCGAYGFPLAAEIKKMGKGAIQICGATQLMFGIMGKRWDDNQSIQSMVTDAWVRPDVMERPDSLASVENGCYW